MSQPLRQRLVIGGCIAVVGLLPVAMFWYFVGRMPTVTPAEARRLLSDPAGGFVLVDVRAAGEFAASHLDGAVNWPYADIKTLADGPMLPGNLAERKLLLICSSGFQSALAGRRLNRIVPGRALSVRGGMQQWMAAAGPACPVGMALSAGSFPHNAQSSSAFPVRQAPVHEQWAAVVTGFGVKPLYMALSLVIAFGLRRERSGDLIALRWAMICFFLGEAFCAANYLVYGERSYLFEYLHSLGMVLAFGFTAYALLEGFDRRIVQYSQADEKCAAISLCHRCIKYTDVPCGLRRVFFLIIPAAGVLALLPLCAPFRMNAYSTRILGTPYSYLHEVVHQVFEIRFLPVVAILLLVVSFVILGWKERHPVFLSKIIFAAGLGALGFSLLRLTLFAPFFDNQVWFTFWEEITELLYVLSAAGVLLIFRRGLFQKSDRNPAETPWNPT